MLFPYSHPWTLFQKWIIASAAAVALALCAAAIYTYERYHRSPTNALFSGAVHASENSDEVFYEEIPDHQSEWKFAPQPPKEINSDSNYEEWQQKFLSGSDKRLGSAADMAAIKRLVPATGSPTIRWISRSVVVVDTSPSWWTRYLYVFEKHGTKWKLTHHYRVLTFPALAPGNRR
jgi:hypothetical protein